MYTEAASRTDADHRNVTTSTSAWTRRRRITQTGLPDGPSQHRTINTWKVDLRDRSCRLRCSLLLKARLQNWHLYFFSGAEPVFRAAGDEAAEAMVIAAAGM